jgi:hypothetical protein
MISPIIKPSSDPISFSSAYDPDEDPMDTLHFEPESFRSPPDRRLSWNPEAPRIDEVNLSEPEIFMLRGRRLQARTMGGALRHGLAKLRHLVGGRRGGSRARHPGCHSHV